MTKITFLIFILYLICPATERDKIYGNVIVSEITSIYDGDTFRANIKGYPPIIGEKISIRINGIDTPEMRGKSEKEKELARKAKQFTVDKLRNAKTIELRNIKRAQRRASQAA